MPKEHPTGDRLILRALQSLGRAITGSNGRGTDWLAYLILVGGLTAWCLILLPVARGAWSLSLNDPDNYQRLAEVRDWLNGQSWWDTKQYRIDPPRGLQLHWSRLGDVPLAILIIAFRPFVGYSTAEAIAVVSLPPLLLLFTAVFLGRTARNLGGVPAESLSRLLLCAAPFVLTQFIPGRIDHHGLQLLMLAGALAAATSGRATRDGLLVALPISFSLLIGLEMVPLLLAIVAWMAMLWLIEGPSRSPQIQGFALGMIIFLPLFYGVSVAPYHWGRATYDEIGRGHIAIILASGATLAILLRNANETRARRLAALSITALAAAFMLWLFPEVVTPPYTAIDPMLERLWTDAISETRSAMSVLKTAPLKLIENYLFPFLALLSGGALYMRKQRKPELLLLLMAGLAGLLLSAWQIRGMSASALIALLLSAVVCAYLWTNRSQSLGILRFSTTVLLLNGLSGAFIYKAIAADDQKQMDEAERGKTEDSCRAALRSAGLDRVKPGLVLNGINLGGPILVHTRHSVLAAANHRAVESNGIAYMTFLTPTSQAHTMLLNNNIDYVLTCRDAELKRLASFGPNSFASDLNDRNIPNWLTEISTPKNPNLLFYAVVDRAPSAKNPIPASGPREQRN